MKLFRSTLGITAVALAALSLYFAYAAPTLPGLADAAPVSSVSKSHDLTPVRTLVQDVTTLLAKVVGAKRRIADLGASGDTVEAGLKWPNGGDSHLADDKQISVNQPVGRNKPASFASPRALSGGAPTVDFARG